jgi:hypothetical protein
LYIAVVLTACTLISCRYYCADWEYEMLSESRVRVRTGWFGLTTLMSLYSSLYHCLYQTKRKGETVHEKWRHFLYYMNHLGLEALQQLNERSLLSEEVFASSAYDTMHAFMRLHSE